MNNDFTLNTNINLNTIGLGTGIEDEALDQLAKLTALGVIDRIQSLTGELSGEEKHGVYKAYADTPELPPPSLENGEQTELPYNRYQRMVIIQDFEANFRASLEEYAKNHSPPLSEEQIQAMMDKYHGDDVDLPPDLEEAAYQLGDQAKALIAKHYKLPPSWTPSSRQTGDWERSWEYNEKADPYDGEIQNQINQEYTATFGALIRNAQIDPPLNENEIQLLINSKPEDPFPLTNRPELQGLVATLRNNALEKIQNKYDLPDTWVPGTTDAALWIPTSISPVNPARFQELFLAGAAKNALNFLEEFVNEGVNFANSLPPGDPNRTLVLDYMKIIADALQGLKEILYSKESNSTQKIKSLVQQKLDMIFLQEDKRAEAAEKQKEAVEEQKKAKQIQEGLKWGGIALAVVGIALSLVSGGASLGLLAVSAAMLAVTIADSVTGFIGKAFEFVIDALDKALKNAGIENEIMAEIITAIAIAVIILLVVVVARSAGASIGRAVGNKIAERSAAQAAQIAGAQAGKVLAIEMAIQLTISSNAIPSLAKTIAKEATSDEEILKWVELAVMIATIIGAMIAGGIALSKVTTVTTTQRAADGTEEFVEVGLKQIEDKALEPLREILKRKLGPERYEKIASNAEGVGSKGALVSLYGTDAVNMASGIVMGMFALEQAKLSKEVGETEAMEEYIAAIIQALDAIIKKLQGETDSEGSALKFASSLESTLKQMYRKTAASMDQAYQA